MTDTEDKRPKLAAVQSLPVKPKETEEAPPVMDNKFFAEYIKEFAEDLEEAGEEKVKVSTVILIVQDDTGHFYTKTPLDDGDLHITLSALTHTVMNENILKLRMGLKDEYL